MADLEDFFAKRDKKKKRAPKFEAENVAKILEKKRVDMSKSHTYQPVLSENTEPISDYKAQEDDDEWREAIEQKPDYSGLKIQELVLEDEDEEEKEGAVEEDGQREGPWRLSHTTQGDPSGALVNEARLELAPTSTEPVVESEKEEVVGDDSKLEKSTESGSKDEAGEPVKKAYIPPAVRKAMEAEAAAATAAAAVAKPLPAPVSNEPKPAVVASVSKYVPAHLRNAGGLSSAAGHRAKKAVAVPNINDTEFFPSLGS